MNINNAYDGLNRKLECPTRGQFETKYSQQFGYEHNLTTNLDLCDRYPVTVLVDSKERVNDSETPGSYTVKLTKSLKNVYSIELIGGKLPSPCYNILPSNNLLTFQETEKQVKTGQLVKVHVPPGDYDATSLALALASAMNQHGINNYRVTIDPITKKFTIAVTNANESSFSGLFNLVLSDSCDAFGDSGFMDRSVIEHDYLGRQFRREVKDVRYGCRRQVYVKGSIGEVLGFSAKNLTGATSYTAQNCYNLSPFSYLALFVNDYDRIQSNNVKVDGSFSIIPLDNNTNSFDTNTRDVDNVRYIRYFYPMLKEINQFTIKFVDPYGNVYDFGGIDNALLFEIGCSFGQPIMRKPQLISGPIDNSQC